MSTEFHPKEWKVGLAGLQVCTEKKTLARSVRTQLTLSHSFFFPFHRAGARKDAAYVTRPGSDCSSGGSLLPDRRCTALPDRI